MNNMTDMPFWLDPKPVVFPPTRLALKDPDGLLAIGGALTQEWLLQAYSQGIFPWFNPDEPILWWTPNPRCVLFIDELKIRRSLRKTLLKQAQHPGFQITLDQQFSQVMRECAAMERKGQSGTWISDAMLQAYGQLHQAGHAHSVEVWLDEELVGGLYGVAIGKMFYGESMFSKVSDASKLALVALSMQLQSWGFTLIDTQVETPHLKSLGARLIPRTEFERQLHHQTQLPFAAHIWHFDIDWVQAALHHAKGQIPCEET